ncbi:magnesium chelatase [Meridianimarinicoccus roseus]|uniref:Magnesium chelatase n=1 Tax=Meridianimarinicoccus roseus TaxID=2072018 RepID=A0A2V2LII8_9RHOB|nr:alpha/beta fold hydrolase BchO [Meridianimarinicoccus roseus]PWR02986.1 magnesium chelatase [Meridianimarinicoccus roseus]
MDRERDLPTWPLHALSRTMRVRPHDWHVQQTGEGPLLVLLHGAGGSTHSFRDLIPLLADTHRVVAIDLPGQGFSRMGTKARCSLRHMAEDIAALCADRGWQPAAIIGHSAGGAIALRLSQMVTAPDGAAPRVIGLNAALAPFDGVAGWLFPVLAKLLVLNPLVPKLFSLTSGNPARVRQLIEGTGSSLSDEGLALYTRLIGDRDHVDATLRMMAQWHLDALLKDLPRLTAEVTLVAADGDRAVPPATSVRAAAHMPRAHVVHLAGLGHLAHEEDPARLAGVIRDALDAPSRA